jgi:putative spermidine/putrescine transport system permease protein
MSDISADGLDANGLVLAADGTPLKRSLARAMRRQKLRALLLVAPLLIFVLLTFIYPIGVMLSRSVQNDIVANTLPETVRVLGRWDASTGELPDEEVYAAFTRDMVIAIADKKHTRLGSRLNYEKTGLSSMFRQSGRKMKKLDPVADAPFKDKLIGIHKGWGDIETWKTLQT